MRKRGRTHCWGLGTRGGLRHPFGAGTGVIAGCFPWLCCFQKSKKWGEAVGFSCLL